MGSIDSFIPPKYQDLPWLERIFTSEHVFEIC